jgi:hypothetical protein
MISYVVWQAGGEATQTPPMFYSSVCVVYDPPQSHTQEECAAKQST